MNTLATLFNLGGPDLLIILIIALLLFGAKKLPELARGMGLAMKEFHKAKDEFDREVTKPVSEIAVQPAVNTLAQNTVVPAPAAPVAASAPASPAAPVPPPASTNLPS
jgi:sec-independent protein translocase protein TatA